MEKLLDNRPQTAAAPKKKASTGTIVFFSLYLAFVLCVLVVFIFAMGPLENWLTHYENSQPEHARDEIYNTLFAGPDWDLVYDLAGVQDTEYEGKAQFIAYMENKVGDRALTLHETSAGLTGGKKYILKLEGEKIATFSMTSTADGEFDRWQLSQVEVFFTRQEGIRIVTMPGNTVYINGIPLDDSFTTCQVTTIAEEYLPSGIHGYQMMRQEISGFLVEPEITVLDENGQAAEVYYDAENDEYHTAVSTSQELTEEFYEIALAAGRINAEYAIRAVTVTPLKEHFDPDTELFQNLILTPVFVQKYRSYSFDEEVTQVTDFYRYSDDLFSARVILKMDVVRKDKTTKAYEMDTTYFFTKNSEGKWLVTNMTNVHIQQRITTVRLQYIQDGQLIHSEMVEDDTDCLYLPTIQVPEGKELLGWAKQEVDAEGNITYTIVLEATENGVVYLPGSTRLEPMTLYPVFEAVE